MAKELATTASISDAELIQHLNNLGLAKELTDGERNTYLQIAKAYNLNPFKREVHVSKYGGQMSIITGYEVYIKRAERTGQLDGWSVVTQGKVDDKSLKAVVTIHRKDRSHPFVWEALYSEYVQLKDGKPNKFWQKATTMIKKVAISQAFRLCFSDELGGMPYTSDEMSGEPVTEDTTPISVETAWQPTDEQWAEANALLNNSTLDDEKKAAASAKLSEAKNQASWTKIINRLREVQTPAS